MPLPSHFTLNTTAPIPAVGFGTWQAVPHEVERAVETTLREGYRHLDCAAIYRNETEFGAGIRNAGVPREEIFLTSKLWNTKHNPEDVEAAVDRSLRDLGVDCLDLYLMHWPVAFAPGDKWFPLDDEGLFRVIDTDCVTTYKAMEKLLSTGKVKAIDVSNFAIAQLGRLLANVSVVPAVNQVEAHPYLTQPALLKYCQGKGILIQAYSPLGNNTTGKPLVQQLASQLGMGAGVLLGSWGVQRGTVVLRKSVMPSRIRTNLLVKELPADVFAQLNGLERHKRFNFPARWGVDIFEEVGDAKVKELARSEAPGNKLKFTV